MPVRKKMTLLSNRNIRIYSPRKRIATRQSGMRIRPYLMSISR